MKRKANDFDRLSGDNRFMIETTHKRKKCNFKDYIASKKNTLLMNKVWDKIYNRQPNYRNLSY